MSVEVDAGTATFTEIVEQMDFTLPCEHWAHDEDTPHHAGHAHWVCRQHCSCNPVALVCDKFKTWIGAVGSAGPCPACGQDSPLTFVKI